MLKILIATLVVGSSSLVGASPLAVTASFSFGYHTQAQPEVRDHRYPVYQPVQPSYPVYDPGYYHRTWTALTSPIHIDDHRAFIDVGSRMSNVRELRLDGLGDATHLDQVIVEFSDGSRPFKVRPERDIGRTSFTIELGAARNVSRVLVYGDSCGARSAFVMSGR